jgi:glycerol kinase
MANRPRAIALDLGTTRFKLGRLDDGGQLTGVEAVPAPALRGEGLVREGDPEEFLSIATGLLDKAVKRDAGGTENLPVGLVSQRSTFTVWDRASGKPLVPMISWRDRRADDWCAANLAGEKIVTERAGLLMSPHYAGPKLAAMQARDRKLSAALDSGNALFGTLDTWLLWNWSRGASHETDLTMAARTALADIDRGDWSPELLDLFDVPAGALPGIRPTRGFDTVVRDGLQLRANIADQASGAIAVLDPGDDVALVNFGTGAFVLYPTEEPGKRIPGYLTAPVLAADGGSRYVLEGTINGAGPALDRFGAGPTELPVADSCPDGFAIPDQTGLGAPHWRAEVGLTLSAAAKCEPKSIQRTIVLEGLLFRVQEILLDLGAGELPDRVIISGGLVRDPAVGLGLARLLGRPVETLDEPESTLLGAARLAAGLDAFAGPATHVVGATDAGAYLADKYSRWKAWMRDTLAE